MYKLAVCVTLSFYAIIIIMLAKIMMEDLSVGIDQEYCEQFTSCADRECCIQATAEKEEHLKYD